jgi:hypothetical protein
VSAAHVSAYRERRLKIDAELRQRGPSDDVVAMVWSDGVVTVQRRRPGVDPKPTRQGCAPVIVYLGGIPSVVAEHLLPARKAASPVRRAASPVRRAA